MPTGNMPENVGTKKLNIFGIKGEPGPQGPKGDRGDIGPQGPVGPAGEPFQISKIYSSISEMNADFSGIDVSVGKFVLVNTGNVEDEDNGKVYIKTQNGYSFVVDMSGSQGIQGPQGIQGIQGPQGEKGETGAKGDKGDKGDQGTVGPQGEKGETGAQGIQGLKGDTGETGAQGPQGIQGYIFTPAVDADGNLSWSNDSDGVLSNPDTVNIKGPQGDKGDKGDKGDIGLTGNRGPQGIQGYTFTPAVDTEGNLSWSNDSNGVLANPEPVSIKGPKGDTGEQGPQGPAGQNGADGNTGPQGIQGYTFTPSVDLDGNLSWTNDSNGVLVNPESVNIKGPQGAQGIQGIQGIQGPAGQNGTNGNSIHIISSPLSFDDVPGYIYTASTNYTVGDLGIVADTGELCKCTIKNSSYPVNGGYATGSRWQIMGNITGPTPDNNEIINGVLAALPTWTGGSY